ncbi:hypothetical protein [Desulforhopalus singaporensis]|uniref:hypothetical protein n=1 Tax=Desulforhopalus singaporensis TaxID=91360 RepID=UPI000B87907E|nr:hypothetical protein [Desulforhopalus singaporensis]
MDAKDSGVSLRALTGDASGFGIRTRYGLRGSGGVVRQRQPGGAATAIRPGSFRPAKPLGCIFLLLLVMESAVQLVSTVRFLLGETREKSGLVTYQWVL